MATRPHRRRRFIITARGITRCHGAMGRRRRIIAAPASVRRAIDGRHAQADPLRVMTHIPPAPIVAGGGAASFRGPDNATLPGN